MKIHYVLGVDNIPADVLSRFYQYVKNEAGQPAGRHSMAGACVACAVCMWLRVVAKHVNFDECIAADVEGLSRELPLASFGYTKCGASHMDLGSTHKNFTQATFVLSVVTSGLELHLHWVTHLQH